MQEPVVAAATAASFFAYAADCRAYARHSSSVVIASHFPAVCSVSGKRGGSGGGDGGVAGGGLGGSGEVISYAWCDP